MPSPDPGLQHEPSSSRQRPWVLRAAGSLALLIGGGALAGLFLLLFVFAIVYPYAPALEDAFLPQPADIRQALVETARY